MTNSKLHLHVPSIAVSRHATRENKETPGNAAQARVGPLRGYLSSCHRRQLLPALRTKASSQFLTLAVAGLRRRAVMLENICYR